MDFWKILWASARRATFFKTSSGSYGSASDLIKTGDIVAILFGSRIPFVSRRHGSGYRLVSPCYLPGFMDGGAIDMWKKGELKEEEFEVF